jgi:hypothetical protein
LQLSTAEVLSHKSIVAKQKSLYKKIFPVSKGTWVFILLAVWCRGKPRGRREAAIVKICTYITEARQDAAGWLDG